MRVKKRLILASRSPRRQHLLRQIGLQFDVKESGVEEDCHTALSPEENVKTLSRLKAAAVGENVSDAIIIGADTIVTLDGNILGKPRNEENAREMLKLLSGRSHNVYTGFTLLDRPSNFTISDFENTKVTFRHISSEEVEEYVRSGAIMDKAGAYGIQDDFGAVFVEKIDGCFYNVIGLPLSKLYLAMLRFQEQIGVV